MRRGIALIIVVGVLAVLAIVATAFVMMAELERKASHQRLLSTKAYLLARSGIEDALARLAAGQDPDLVRNRYRGEDWNDDGVVNAGPEELGQVYLPSAAGSIPDRDDCPLRHAMRPSFSVLLGPDPRRLNVDGRDRGYSGLLAGHLQAEGNTYALKVSSPSGFFVNGGDPSQPVVAGVGGPGNYNHTLRRMLGTLAKAIDEEQGGLNGLPVAEADGWALIDSRPLMSAGWTSFDQIRTTALGGSQAKLDALKPYLVLKAWVDKRVIRPNVTDGTGGTVNMVGKGYRNWAGIKLDHRVHPLDAASRRPDFERIPLDSPSNIVGRAPVDLAWARSRRPALIALMSGLKGLYLDETTQSNTLNAMIPTVDLIGTLRAVEITNTWIATDDCHTAASALAGTAMELTTWQGFNAFCDTLPFTATSSSPLATSDLRQATRDLLKANFNPNSVLNKFNPNPSLWRSVDKSDLLAYSTEFSLFPVTSREIESVGRVLGREGRLLALRVVKAGIPAPSLVRLSTQREFVCSVLGDLQTAGDEMGFRIPGDADYLSLSRGMSRTWGHSRFADPDRGTGLQVYPEPTVATGGGGTALSINPADYDGNLQLATVELQTNQYFDPPVTATTKDMKMLARFDDGFDLDVADADALNQTDVSQVTTAQLSNSLLASFSASSTKPNTLYPDGAYSEKDRAPAYKDKGNSDGYHGLLSFWVKNSVRQRNFAELANTTLNPMRGHQYVYRTNFTSSDWSSNQYHSLGFFYSASGTFGPCFVGMFEIGHSSVDTNEEFRFSTDGRYADKPRLWHLVTWCWDFRSATLTDAGDIRIDAGGPSNEDFGADNNYQIGMQKSINSLSATDITADETLPSKKGPVYAGPHLLGLGRHGKAWYSNVNEDQAAGDGADATLDEFALYDFGGAGPGGEPANPPGTLPGDFASARYAEGRYYKDATYHAPGAAAIDKQAGSWISAPIPLPAGSTLLGVHWTWYRPSAAALASDYAEVELLKEGTAEHLWTAAQSRSRLAAGWSKERQDWNVNRILPGTIRARVVFRRDSPSGAGALDQSVAAGTPLLDSPVFDDLTFVYTGGGGVPITDWREGE